MQIMKLIKLSVLIPFLALLLFAQCAQDKLPASYAAVGICYETEIEPIIVSNCTQSTCHNPVDLEDGYDFTTYDGIMTAVRPFKPNQSELYESITEADLGDIMPPPPNNALSAAQIALIKDWIDKGAPETINCFTTCDTLASVSFSASVLPIVNTYCNGCHSGNTPQGGIDQSNWQAVKLTVDDGSFLGSIRHDNGFSSMPPSGAKINACDILTLETWVAEGAQNN